MEKKDDFGLDSTPDRERESTKQIMEINPNWPWWHRLIGNLINASGVFVWIAVTVICLYVFQGNPELVGYRNNLLNVIVTIAAYGILSFVAGLTLVSWFFPYFNYRRIMATGTPIEKASCMVFWGLIAIALAIVIAGAA
jgi:hypothetical protein